MKNKQTRLTLLTSSLSIPWLLLMKTPVCRNSNYVKDNPPKESFPWSWNDISLAYVLWDLKSFNKSSSLEFGISIPTVQFRYCSIFNLFFFLKCYLKNTLLKSTEHSSWDHWPLESLTKGGMQDYLWSRKGDLVTSQLGQTGCIIDASWLAQGARATSH